VVADAVEHVVGAEPKPIGRAGVDTVGTGTIARVE
jgi:hypothetical protein